MHPRRRACWAGAKRAGRGSAELAWGGVRSSNVLKGVWSWLSGWEAERSRLIARCS